MVNIQFSEDDDINFMGLNVFSHDFIHDFNTVKFGSRMSKISVEIDKLRESVIGRTIPGVAEPHVESPRAREPELAEEKKPTKSKAKTVTPLIEVEVAEEKKTSKSRAKSAKPILEEPEAVDSPEDNLPFEGLSDAVEFGRNEQADRVIRLLHSTDIPALSTCKDIFNAMEFLRGSEVRITRSRAHLIQQASALVDETKLYVVGSIKLKKKAKRGGRLTHPHARRSVRVPRHRINSAAIFKNESLKNEKGINTKRQTLRNVKRSFSSKHSVRSKNSLKTATIQNYDFHTSIEEAFSSVINEARSENLIDLANYFSFMGQLYLFFKDEKKSPFQTLKIDYIDDMLFMYLFCNSDQKKILNESKENTHLCLETMKMHYETKKGGMKMKGGENPKDFLFRIGGDMNFGLIYTIYSSGQDESAIDSETLLSLVEYVNGIYAEVTHDEDIKPFLKTNILRDLNKDMNNNLTPFLRVKDDPTSRNFLKYKAGVFKAICNLLIDNVFNILTDHTNKLEAKLNAPVEIGTLSPSQKNDVQMISIIVARGGLNFILPKNFARSSHNSLIMKEVEILSKIAQKSETAKRDFGTVDGRLKDAFIEYALTIDENRTLTEFDQIKDVVTKLKRGKGKIAVVNNAASKEILAELGIETPDIICPTSSVVDAMGSIGSCYGTIPAARKEYNNMSFKLMGPNPNNLYEGETELTNNNKNVKITFGATFNDFYLPDVEVNIDITTPKIVTLSANTTLKSVINKVLSIWNRVYENKVGMSESEIWGLFESKMLFVELVSCGAVKSVGDFFQEINSVAENGGYKNTIAKINEKYRIGVNGDQPSGVRAGYILLKATNGVNLNSMAGYIGEGDSSIMILRKKS
jgi:hypothetical protein